MANDLTNSIMRTVSFVERIEVEFHGNIMTQTMVLADVDNDMANELIVGNIDGFVAIFKGESAQPWKKTTVNGMLTCLAVGKVHLSNKNSLVCMTAEGWCYIYNINSDSSSQCFPCSKSMLCSYLSYFIYGHVTRKYLWEINNSVEDDGESPSLKPVFTQELPANAKVMCLADIDSDGHIEMVIGYSDRVVRAFRWKDNPDSDGGQFVLIQRWQLAGQIGSITINYNKYHEPELMVSQPGATFVTLLLKPTFRQIKSDSYLDKMTGTKKDSSFERNGSFVSAGRADIIASKSDISSIHSDSMSNKLADSSQDLNRSDSMSQKQNSRMDQGDHNKSPEKPELKSKVSLTLDKLTSSPPAKTSFSSPDCSEHDKSDEKLNHIFDVKDSCEEEIFKPNLIYHPLAHMQARNKDTSTVIVGGINRERVSQSSSDSELHTTATYYALATLDGSLILVENDSILWSLQVDHYLFTLAKLDVTGNGQEEVVCCSWSGQTYIVNHSKEIVRYNFPDSVAAFCAGNYSLHGEDSNSPCFVYATFNNKIYIYPNLTLPRVESTNLLEVMQRRPGTRELLQKLNINADDHETLRKLYRYCLYGQHKKPKE